MFDMRRREFITLLGGMAAVWPFAAHAQRPERMQRIGVLMAIGENDEGRARIAAFREELHRLGRVEGRNIQIETRWAAGDEAKLQDYAKKLVSLKPDIILANATPAARALQQHTSEIPVVFVLVADPVGDGLVTNLARLGGNLTGFTSTEFSLAGKWLQIFKECVPSVQRVAMLFNPSTAPGGGWPYVHTAEAAAGSFAVQIVGTPVADGEEIERVLDQFARQPNSGLIVVADAFTTARAELIVARATHNRLPALYPLRLFATAGGLLSYGIDTIGPFRQAASYVDRVLKGEKPAELPVQAPMKFELVINLKTAKALGLDIPPTLLARADEVIE
jgi:putative tryptophan/tyrosine transport system substrate-binding protein